MIQDIQPGQIITNFFVLRKKEIRKKQKNDDLYLSVELCNASGRIFGFVWENAQTINNSLKEGEVVKVKGTVTQWKDRCNLSVSKIRRATDKDNVDINSLVPKADVNADEGLAEIQEMIRGIENTFLKKLLELIFNDSQLWSAYSDAVGGKLWHHCYQGGLLEHSIQVVKLVRFFAAQYPSVNIDLLTTGALLHDIGKIYEYHTAPMIEYSDKGRLLGHVFLGSELLCEKMNNIKDFPELLRSELLHLILSHHGTPESGSNIKPMSREAILLNYADEIDSKMNAFSRIELQQKEPDKRWSNYVNLLDRFLYLGTSQ